MASHNNFVDASWFYPAFTLEALSTDPSLGIILVGQETLGSETVFHLLISHVLPSANSQTVALVQQLSAMDLYLDATALVPVEIDFTEHPDSDTGVNIPVAIRFGGYQSFNGIQAPTHIQKYVQGTLVLDLSGATAAINSGVSASVFTLPNISAGGAQ